MSKPCGREAAKYVQKFGLNQVHDAIVAYQSGKYLLITIMEEGEEDVSNSLNAYLIAEGYAMLDKDIKTDEMPEDV